MILDETDIQILKDVYSFKDVKRYHGLLPAKFLLTADAKRVERLESECLIEKGRVEAQCGANFQGYRLTEHALHNLRQLGYDLSNDDFICRLRNLKSIDPDELDKRHIDILSDIFHLSKLCSNSGLAPKSDLKKYDKKELRLLFDLGLILSIKVKSECDDSYKGYILSELGRRLLQQVGYIN